MGILRRLSEMRASAFLSTFLFISVFWCQANADHQEDEDEDAVHLHFHLNQNNEGSDGDDGDDVAVSEKPDDGDDVAVSEKPDDGVDVGSSEEKPYPTYNRRLDPAIQTFKRYVPYLDEYRGPYVAHDPYRPRYRDDAPWKRWSPAGNQRDPCDAVNCRAETNNSNGFPKFNRGFRPLPNDHAHGSNTVNGCCSNSMNVVG